MPSEHPRASARRRRFILRVTIERRRILETLEVQPMSEEDGSQENISALIRRFVNRDDDAINLLWHRFSRRAVNEATRLIRSLRIDEIQFDAESAADIAFFNICRARNHHKLDAAWKMVRGFLERSGYSSPCSGSSWTNGTPPGRPSAAVAGRRRRLGLGRGRTSSEPDPKRRDHAGASTRTSIDSFPVNRRSRTLF